MKARSKQNEIDFFLFKGKALFVFGARQGGKTSLAQKTCHNTSVLWLNGDEIDTQLLPENSTSD